MVHGDHHVGGLDHGVGVLALGEPEPLGRGLGDHRDDWLIVLQESSYPYSVGRRQLSTDFIDIGRHQYREALAYYCQCLNDDYWPGLDDGITAAEQDSRQRFDNWNPVEPADWMYPQVEA